MADWNNNWYGFIRVRGDEMNYPELQEEISRLAKENDELSNLLVSFGLTANKLIQHTAEEAIKSHSVDAELIKLLNNISSVMEKTIEVLGLEERDGLS